LIPLHRFRALIRWEPEFTRLFARLLLPIALQNLVSASLQIVDGVMVSGLGEAAAAGVAQANRITFVVQLFLFGVISGAGIFFAQFWGKGDIAGMRRVQGVVLRLAAGIAGAFVLAVACFPRRALGMFLPAGPSFEIGLEYLLTVLPVYVIYAVDGVFAAMLRASERARIPMLAGIAAIATNTALNYGLIYGRLGLPAIGARGAALATVIAAGLSLCINVGVSYRRGLAPAATPRDLRMPDRAFLRRFFKTIAPVVLNEGLWGAGVTMYSVVYGRMGDATVAAMSIVNTVDQLVFVFGWGIMNAAAVIVGRSIGAGREREAYLYAKRLLLAAVGIMVATGAALLLARGPIVRIFRYGAETRAMAMRVLTISAFFLGMRAFNAVNVVGVLRSGGDTVFSMLLDLGVLWLFGVPAAALCGLSLRWALPLVYLATQLEECIKVCIGLPRLRSKKWIHNLVRDTDLT
jgi:putative MATE family efflux protein